VSSLQQKSTAQSDSLAHAAPRLGVLLHNFRAEVGETAKTVSRRCALGPVEIAQLELGRADLTADELADVVAAYAVPRVIFPIGHCRIGVDLGAGTVAVAVTDDEVTESTADRSLLVYFELVFSDSGMAPATPMPFTALDLDVLRLVLSSRRNEVNQHLHEMVGPFDEALDESAVAHRHLVRNAMLAFAATAAAIAGSVAVHEATNHPAAAPVPIETQIIDAVFISRDSVDGPIKVGGGGGGSSDTSRSDSVGTLTNEAKDSK